MKTAVILSARMDKDTEMPYPLNLITRILV